MHGLTGGGAHAATTTLLVRPPHFPVSSGLKNGFRLYIALPYQQANFFLLCLCRTILSDGLAREYNPISLNVWDPKKWTEGRKARIMVGEPDAQGP